MLRLVDLGKFIQAPAGDVKTNLPVELLEEPGLAIWCHLEGIILTESLHKMILSLVMEKVKVPTSVILMVLVIVVFSYRRTG